MTMINNISFERLIAFYKAALFLNSDIVICVGFYQLNVLKYFVQHFDAAGNTKYIVIDSVETEKMLIPGTISQSTGSELSGGLAGIFASLFGIRYFPLDTVKFSTFGLFNN